MINKIAMLVVIAAFLICVIILVTGFILDFIGFYKRMARMEHYMNNDEYDYGHDVKHKEEGNG